MSILRGRLVEPSAITVTLDKNRYDANTETWPIVIKHNAYQQERFERTISVSKTSARDLFTNWDKVQKTGVQGFRVWLLLASMPKDVSKLRVGYMFSHCDDPIQRFEATFDLT